MQAINKPSMDVDLTDQTAIVTGSAQGIGKVIAEELGKKGASVVVTDIETDKGESVAEELRANGSDSEYIQCDVTSTSDTERLVESTLDTFGSIDIFVNNAAIASEGTFTDLDSKSWTDLMDVNLNGPFNCLASVVPTMIEQGSGSIVNISSMAGRNISYGCAPDYTASKWGLIGFTKHLAWDLGEHGIRVNTVCPGMVLTPLNQKRIPSDRLDARRQNIALDEFPYPEDIANGVLYLVSEASAKQTGTIMEIDSGEQLGPRPEVIEHRE